MPKPYGKESRSRQEAHPSRVDFWLRVSVAGFLVAVALLAIGLSLPSAKRALRAFTGTTSGTPSLGG